MERHKGEMNHPDQVRMSADGTFAIHLVIEVVYEQYVTLPTSIRVLRTRHVRRVLGCLGSVDPRHPRLGRVTDGQLGTALVTFGHCRTVSVEHLGGWRRGQQPAHPPLQRHGVEHRHEPRHRRRKPSGDRARPRHVDTVGRWRRTRREVFGRGMVCEITAVVARGGLVLRRRRDRQLVGLGCRKWVRRDPLGQDDHRPLERLMVLIDARASGDVRIRLRDSVGGVCRLRDGCLGGWVRRLLRPGRSQQLLIEHWNGTTWSYVSGPAPETNFPERHAVRHRDDQQRPRLGRRYFNGSGVILEAAASRTGTNARRRVDGPLSGAASDSTNGRAPAGAYSIDSSGAPSSPRKTSSGESPASSSA
jgi:hypothetical protein